MENVIPPTYKNLTPFKRCVLQNFPFIEEDFDALTNYGLLGKIVEYLNNVISSQNTVQENITALNNAFIELKSQVDNYFDNLDVQEEINAKLDEMAESGEIGNLMGRYIDPKLADFQDQVTEDLASMRQIVESVGSGSPIPVSSTDEMTDHNKTYLLTSDGYWYYYSGTEWTRGGVYQATGLADESVTPVKTTFSKRSANLIDVKNVSINNWIIETNPYRIADGGTNNPSSTIYIPVTGGKTYTFIRKSSNVPRLMIGFTTTTPDIDVSVTGRHETPSGTMSYTVTAPSNATYAIINFARRNAIPAGLTENDLLAEVCVNEGISTDFEYSYIIDVKTDNIADGSVTPDKVSFNKDSRNLFNKNNPDLGTYHFVSGVIASESVLRSITIPCEPNTVYTVLKRQSERFEVGTTNVKPEAGVASLSNTVNNSATKIMITTPANANYLLIYCYNANRDTLSLEQILDSICVTEGDNDTFIPYGKIVRVSTNNYDDNSVTMEKLSDGVKTSILGLNPISSRSKIFGVSFDVANNATKCNRIADAEGLKNDYIVGSNFQLNGGVNDFDNVYPWSDIRRCNVKFVNGVKTVTYEGETGFTLDGTNGEVMVEIPKFYSYRKRIGNIETWAISGEPKAEFSVEPAFIVDGEELDYIYVGCYDAANANNGVYSYSGAAPKTSYSKSNFIADFEAANLNSYDITTFFALQKLMVIEFGDRDVQKYIGGVTYLPYFYRGDPVNLITAVGENTVTIANNDGGGRKAALWVGERVRFITANMSEGSEEYARYITNITINGNSSVITYSGSDLSSVLSVGDGFGGAPQNNGLTDSLTYHTGRTTFASGNAYENYVNPMRYRFIENLYGNVWEQIAGFRVQNLKYFICYDPDYNESVEDENSKYFNISYDAPLQDQLGEGGAGYIVSNGYDNNNHAVALPLVVGTANGGGANKFFADAFYSRQESASKQYEAVVGGGWDHYQMSGVFCLRTWNNVNSAGGLYGNRPIIRQ